MAIVREDFERGFFRNFSGRTCGLSLTDDTTVDEERRGEERLGSARPALPPPLLNSFRREAVMSEQEKQHCRDSWGNAGWKVIGGVLRVHSLQHQNRGFTESMTSTVVFIELTATYLLT